MQELGDQALALEDWESAVRLYTYGLFSAPECVQLMVKRAAAHWGTRRLRQVREDAVNAYQVDPTCEEAYYLATSALVEMNLIEEALETVLLGLSFCSESLQLSQLRDSLEADLSSLSEENPLFTSMSTWLQSAGGYFPKLRLKQYSPSFRGIVTSAFVYSGELVFSLPLSHLMTVEKAMQSGLGRRLVGVSKHTYLAVFLLKEMRNPNSSWKPHIDLLPKTFNTFPLFYTEEELSLLAGSPLLRVLRESRESMEADYQAVCECAPEFREYSLLDFLQARTWVASRVFGLHIDGARTDAMVPYADMLNHKRPPQTSWSYDSLHCAFRITATEDLPRNTAVHCSYGRHSSAHLLINYGFVEEGNEADDCVLQIEMDLGDPLLKRKQEILRASDVVSVRVEVDSWKPVVGVVRVLQCDTEDMLAQLARTSREPFTGTFTPLRVESLSTEHEKRTMLAIAEVTERLLSRYPSVEGDRERGVLSENHRNILVFLAAEKRVLRRLNEFAISSYRSLQSKEGATHLP